MKLRQSALALSARRSLPVRGRGLKRPAIPKAYRGLLVAPRAGAWIETLSVVVVPGPTMSLPVRGRGLKQN